MESIIVEVYSEKVSSVVIDAVDEQRGLFSDQIFRQRAFISVISSEQDSVNLCISQCLHQSTLTAFPYSPWNVEQPGLKKYLILSEMFFLQLVPGGRGVVGSTGRRKCPGSCLSAREPPGRSRSRQSGLRRRGVSPGPGLGPPGSQHSPGNMSLSLVRFSTKDSNYL